MTAASTMVDMAASSTMVEMAAGSTMVDMAAGPTMVDIAAGSTMVVMAAVSTMVDRVAGSTNLVVNEILHPAWIERVTVRCSLIAKSKVGITDSVYLKSPPNSFVDSTII